MIDTNKLRRLAQAAMHPITKGHWMRLFGERTVYDRMEDGCRVIPVVSTPFSPPHPFEAACLDFIAAANPATINELLDRLEAVEQTAQDYLRIDREKAQIAQRLEAAEKERDAARKCADMLALALNTSNHERDALRAKIAEIEKQEPVAKVTRNAAGQIRLEDAQGNAFDLFENLGATLYALPGAKGEEK